MVMKKYNISEAKSRFSAVIESVEAGEQVYICKRNRPVARLTACKDESGSLSRHHTQIGWAKGEVKILGDVNEPAIPAGDWDMLK